MITAVMPRAPVPLAARVGIVVVASPARSHPSTELVDSVLSSLDLFEGNAAGRKSGPALLRQRQQRQRCQQRRQCQQRQQRQHSHTHVGFEGAARPCPPGSFGRDVEPSATPVPTLCRWPCRPAPSAAAGLDAAPVAVVCDGCRELEAEHAARLSARLAIDPMRFSKRGIVSQAWLR